jgi:NAD(P)H-dependent flavin oxidoreductase YrpB (nitropropane dioxygenase family)
MVLEEAVVTSAIDWKPQRVIATPFVKSLERTPHLTRLPRAAMAAWRFRNVTGTSFVALIRQGLQKRVDQALNWSQLALAANAPMLTRAALVEADLTAGIMPAGQVAGIITGLPSVAEPRAQIRNEVEESHGRLAGMRTVG